MENSPAAKPLLRGDGEGAALAADSAFYSHSVFFKGPKKKFS